MCGSTSCLVTHRGMTLCGVHTSGGFVCSSKAVCLKVEHKHTCTHTHRHTHGGFPYLSAAGWPPEPAGGVSEVCGLPPRHSPQGSWCLLSPLHTDTHRMRETPPSGRPNVNTSTQVQ